MGRINWGRVFVGGLVAGLIINLFESVTNGVVLAANWGAPMKVAAIWLYAAARPRFAAGPKTAALTGFTYWIMGYALPTLGQIQWDCSRSDCRSVASVVGAWFYRE